MTFPFNLRQLGGCLLIAACIGLMAGIVPAEAANDEIKIEPIKITPGQVTVIQTNKGLVNLNDLNANNSNLVIVGPPPGKPSGPVCGGANQKKCADQPAKFESAARGNCPKGSFFDIGLWQCWSCPKGFTRTAAAVDTDRACSRPNKNIKGTYTKANFMGPVCPKGTFYDGIRDGECRKCPDGYKRSAAHVDAKNACFVAAREDFQKIRRHARGKGLLKTDCPKGQFWDAIDGYCYSCPSGYNRTAYSVRDKRACSKAIKEQQAKAAHVKKGACEKGEFRDALYQRGGDGGTCWTCPKAHDRTVFPVHGAKACEKGGGIEFKTASKVADLTCPAGQVFDFIGLSANDIRTRPELKGSKQKPIKSGTCWSCDSGYDRTLASVKAKNACSAKTMVWYSRPFDEPGLFSLDGAEEVLIDIAKRNPKLIAQSIEQAARTASKSDKKLTLANARKQEIARFQKEPHKSTAAAAAILTRIVASAGEPKHASPAEKKLAKSFSSYIIAKRSHVAVDALAAYDAWKQADTYWRAQENNRKGLMTLLDYGTVPPDYSTVALMNSLAINTAGTALGIATGSIPVLGDVLGVALGAAGNGFGDFSSPDQAARFGARTAAELAVGKAIEFAITQLAKSTVKSLATQAAQKVGYLAAHRAAAEVTKQAGSRLLSLAGGAGPQIIVSVAFMIGTTAIDQVTEIANARPKLQNAVAHAGRDPDLARMVKSNAGNTELLGYWSFLISGEKKPSANFVKEFAKVAAKAAATPAPKVKYR